MFRILYDPDRFFRDRGENPSLVRPALIVFLVGLVDAARGWIVFETTNESMAGGTAAFAAISQVVGVVQSLLVVFLIWAAYAVAFYALSSAFDAEGSFERTLKLVGWGFVPAILGTLVTVVAMYLALQNVSPPETVEGIREFNRQLRSQSVLAVGDVVRAAFLLWQGLIWSFAVKHARQLDLRRAAVSVGVPVLVAVAWHLSDLL